MDFRLIRAFCAVYEEGSINKAASRLNIAQPSISIAIRNLETDLNTTLFRRSATGVAPTVVAHGLYVRLQKILMDLEAARKAVTGETSDIRGPLRVALPPRVAKFLSSTIIPQFLDEYPDVELSIVEVLPQRLIDFTIRGEVDFSITLDPPTDKRLTVSRVAIEPIVLIASPYNIDLPSGRINLTEMPPLKLVVPGLYPLRSILDRYIEADSLPISRIIEIEMVPTILDLVKASDWVTLLPVSSMFGEYESLIAREIAYPGMVTEIFSIRPSRKKMSAAARLFLEEVEKAFIQSIDAWKQNIAQASSRPNA
ncbi:LysR family transcriptional regulator [Sphingobium sp. SJ10-10]|uniref:LysR family transcriptional regulator n=1 Tax=Sphingobium sp. SJ10-10 TaxID=3114999 RepID=UPI002E1879F9|nr:LysR family transcriptional regulator [Sphingobium sp. SJ10-10]